MGLTLLLYHWFNISPAISAFAFNFICYAFGWKVLGKDFIAYSIIAGLGFSAFYAIFERFDPLWPGLVNLPLLAAVLGAVFVGVGVGLCVRIGGAPCADDALAMGFVKLTRLKIQWIYLISDVVVLGLSATYIPINRLAYSLLSVVLSGQLVGLMQRIRLPKAVGKERIKADSESACAKPDDQCGDSESACAKPDDQCGDSESACAKPDDQHGDSESACAKPDDQCGDSESACAKPDDQ